ncbi:MAG: hypothetical protein AB1486_04180 [Planctomycetota bacterium]
MRGSHVTAALIVISFLLFSASLHLWARLAQVSSEVRTGKEYAGIPGGVREAIAEVIDEGLLPAANGWGLKSLAVEYREAHDRFSTVAQLLSLVASEVKEITPTEAQDLAKHLYQLQQTLGIPVARMNLVLQHLLAPLDGASYLGRPISRVVTMAPGTLVDRQTMWPLSSGTRVIQPLGVILFDADDRVISRAKVLCG